MSYKLDQEGNVQHVESGTYLPARYTNGVVELLDEYSPLALAFKAWVDEGGVPEPCDPMPETQPAVQSDKLADLLVQKNVITEEEKNTLFQEAVDAKLAEAKR